VEETDVGVGTENLLSVQLEDKTEHTVRGRVLGTKVDCRGERVSN
jgi:hypothetical protein